MNKPLFYVLLLITTLCSCSKETNDEYNVMDFGAVGDGVADDAKAIEAAITACSENGGRVVFPAGKIFMAGPIELKSNVELFFEPNSTLLASPDESKYNLSAFGDNRGEGMMWIWGKNLENISITGIGKIDGNGVSFMGEELEDSFELKPVTDFDPRPHLLTLINCRNIRIKDVSICNSAYWTVHLVGCYDVAISDISLLNNLKVRNGDGIDVDHSKKVRISDCYIESGDDCICLKNRREYDIYGGCRDIVVSNCILTSRSCAIKIGSENVDTIENVLFNNCIITDSNRGVGIQNRDEGIVRNVTFNNMLIDCHLFSDVWWGKSEPIYVTSYPRASVNHKDANWRFPKGATEGRCGEVSNISFNNINCTSENGIFLGCEEQGKVKAISFNNVCLQIRKETSYKSAVYDRRPCRGEGFVEAQLSGIFGENVSDIYMNNFRVEGAPVGSFINSRDIIGI